jgi:hypothetical protein
VLAGVPSRSEKRLLNAEVAFNLPRPGVCAGKLVAAWRIGLPGIRSIGREVVMIAVAGGRAGGGGLRLLLARARAPDAEKHATTQRQAITPAKRHPIPGGNSPRAKSSDWIHGGTRIKRKETEKRAATFSKPLVRVQSN